jgi:hypothetical protein
MHLVIITALLLGLTSLWVLPFSLIIAFQNISTHVANALRSIRKTEGAWYWPLLWAISLATMIACFIIMFPMIMMWFQHSSFGSWFFHTQGDFLNEEVVLYNSIVLTHQEGNLWMISTTFLGIVGLKVSHLGCSASWTFWRGQDVTQHNAEKANA